MRCIAFLLIALPSAASAADSNLVIGLNGLAAECSILGSGKYTEAQIAQRDYGDRSKQYKALLHEAYAIADGCVKDALPKGREQFKAEVAANPGLKDKILETYSSWVGYMKWLSSPHEWADEGSEKSAYEAAARRLQAEMDLL